MALLRDIVAAFAIQVDMRPLTELDKQINKVHKRLGTFAKYAAGFGTAAAAGIWKLTDFGSRADENLNVLQQTFKDNSEEVIEWSKTTGAAMKRSTFDMQEAVGKFGAFLGPVFKDSGQDVDKMSEKLTELAVDLASFYNTSDKEAIDRLFSGMSGETEAVRRLGIDISDTTLEDLNRRVNGDPRTMRALTLAEKAALRLQKIMIDTEDKQGDAVRTAHQWAGRLKAVQARLHTLAVVYGRRLIPWMKKGLDMFEATLEVGVRFVENLENIGSNLRAGAITLGFMGLGWVFINRQALMLVAHMYHLLMLSEGMYKRIAKAGLQAAALAASFYAIEDVVTFLRGGESLTGKLLTELTGIEEPMAAIENGAERLVTHFMNAVTWVRNLFSALTSGGANWGAIMGAVATGNYGAAAMELAKAAPSADAFSQENLSKGLLDVDAPTRMREEQRRQAVERGDIDAFHANRRKGSSMATSEEEFLAQRHKTVADMLALYALSPEAGSERAAAINLTEADVETGAIGAEMVQKVLPRGNVTMGDIIINGVTDPEAVGKVVDERVRQTLSEAFGAEGEEQ